MVVVPALAPIKIPDDEPIVAVVVLLLVQVPPPTDEVRVVVDPLHKYEVPLIVPDPEMMVSILVLKHPVVVLV